MSLSPLPARESVSECPSPSRQVKLQFGTSPRVHKLAAAAAHCAAHAVPHYTESVRGSAYALLYRGSLSAGESESRCSEPPRGRVCPTRRAPASPGRYLCTPVLETKLNRAHRVNQA
eukprot:3922498-Rhodomonas_salina.1